MKGTLRPGAVVRGILVLTLVLGAVGALIGIPMYRKHRLQENQRHVYRAMCTLHTVQANRPWTRDVAGALEADPALLPGVADADTTPGRSSTRAPVPFRGYYFRALDPSPPHGLGGGLLDLENRGSFVIVAYPAEYGWTGHMTYYGNGFGIFSKDNGGRCPDRALTIKELRGAPEYWSIID